MKKTINNYNIKETNRTIQILNNSNETKAKFTWNNNDGINVNISINNTTHHHQVPKSEVVCKNFETTHIMGTPWSTLLTSKDMDITIKFNTRDEARVFTRLFKSKCN